MKKLQKEIENYLDNTILLTHYKKPKVEDKKRLLLCHYNIQKIFESNLLQTELNIKIYRTRTFDKGHIMVLVSLYSQLNLNHPMYNNNVSRNRYVLDYLRYLSIITFWSIIK